MRGRSNGTSCHPARNTYREFGGTVEGNPKKSWLATSRPVPILSLGMGIHQARVQPQGYRGVDRSICHEPLWLEILADWAKAPGIILCLATQNLGGAYTVVMRTTNARRFFRKERWRGSSGWKEWATHAVNGLARFVSIIRWSKNRIS